MDLSLTQWGLIWGVLALAYVIFGMAGFGTALIAGPVLAHFMPLAQIVPLLALLDCLAAIMNLLRDGAQADRTELKRLVPFMLIGSAVGAAILLVTRPDALLLLLGVFATAYALYSLSGFKPHGRFASGWSLPFGLVGGVFSALFGSGGFLYAIYLAGRIDNKDGIRVTQSALIGMSTLTRALIFLFAGVYMDRQLLLMALLLLPAMWLGTWVGRRITLRLSRENFVRVLSGVILLSGLTLLVRYFTQV